MHYDDKLAALGTRGGGGRAWPHSLTPHIRRLPPGPAPMGGWRHCIGGGT